MLKIRIETNADLTPNGKRVVKIVSTLPNGRRCKAQVRWYVGNRVYRFFDGISNEVIELSNEWKQAQQ